MRASSPTTPPTALSGPYTPTLILHGGAGSITKSRLPPPLYRQYEASLLKYLTSTRSLLFNGTNALTAAVHAVSLMEDDPLFNCGRGAVFTEQGTIEMEASVMVTRVREDQGSGESSDESGIPPQAFIKRGAGVMMIKETRHPIQLARQVLLHPAVGQGSGGSMHCQLAGEDVEETGFKEWGMQRMGKDWFWTRKRWVEHLRGLEGREKRCRGGASVTSNAPQNEGDLPDRLKDSFEEATGTRAEEDDDSDDDGYELPSQGTVGCVCLDQWGNLAVATSTGGLTNKKVGRIGDTPTLGAGFWAESWASDDKHMALDPIMESTSVSTRTQTQNQFPGPSEGVEDILQTMQHNLRGLVRTSLRPITACLPQLHSSLPPLPLPSLHHSESLISSTPRDVQPFSPRLSEKMILPTPSSRPRPLRHAVALSGTGNGDSFLRVSAARTVAARSRFLNSPLRTALSEVAGPGGELQRSAGDRWGNGGAEGEGGIIGVEIVDPLVPEMEQGRIRKATRRGTVVWDFNCGGMWRAFWDEEKRCAKVLAFRGEYEDEPDV